MPKTEIADSTAKRFVGVAGSRRRSGIREICGFVAVAAACACCDMLLPARPGLATAALLYLIWAVWLTKREANAALLTLNPLVCYQAWQAVVLGVAPLYISLGDSGDGSVRLGNQLVDLEWIAFGHAIMVAGCAAFYAGVKRFQPKETVSETAPLSSASPLRLAGAVVVGSFFLVFREDVTQLAGSTVAQLSYLPTAVLCIVATSHRGSQPRSARARFWIVLAGCLWLLLLNSRRTSKMELILSFFPLIWLLLRMRKQTWLLMGAAALTALYLFVIAPLVSDIRANTSLRNEEGGIRAITPDDTAEALTGLRQNWLSDPVAYFQTWLDLSMVRMCDPVAAGLVASLADSGGFLLGSRLDYIPLAFIPRALWRDKPNNNRGAVLSSQLGMTNESGLVYTFTGETSAGEFYWNFGWPGVLLGMYVLGAAIAGLWWRAAGTDPRRGLFEMTAFTGATLSFVLGLNAAAGPLLVTCISSCILWRALIALRRAFFSDRTIAARARRLRTA